MCDASGKLSGVSSESDEEDCRELPWQRGDVPVIDDSGASCHISCSSTGMFNYRESNATMRTASGEKRPVEGYGDLSLTFMSNSGNVPLLHKNVAHVRSRSYHLLSLRAIEERGHTFFGDHEGITLRFSSGETLFFSSVERLNILYAYRPGTPVDETANATIAPMPTTSGHKTVDINDFHVAHAHAHEGALKKTAKKMGVNLEGEMHECKGCSMAKGFRMSIPKKTDNRA